MRAVDFPAFVGFAPVESDVRAAVRAFEPAVDGDVEIGFEFLLGMVASDGCDDGGVAFDGDLAGIFAEVGIATAKVIGREIARRFVVRRGELDLRIEEFF